MGKNIKLIQRARWSNKRSLLKFFYFIEIRKYGLIFFVVFYCCSSCDSSDSAIEGNEIKADIEVALDSNFVIEFDENPSTGYSWFWEKAQSNHLVDTIYKEYIANQPVLPGSSGKRIWKFNAKSKGLDTIHFIFKRGDVYDSTVHYKKFVVKVY